MGGVFTMQPTASGVVRVAVELQARDCLAPIFGERFVNARRKVRVSCADKFGSVRNFVCGAGLTITP